MTTIYDVLDDLKIAYQRHDHPAVFTVEEADAMYRELPGGTTKNLFLRNKKGSRHILAVVDSARRVDIRALGEKLGEKNLSFASPERLKQYLGLTPGSVSPLGLMHDKEAQAVELVLDASLWQHEELNFHPNINTATLTLTKVDFERFLNWSGHTPHLVEMDA